MNSKAASAAGAGAAASGSSSSIANQPGNEIYNNSSIYDPVAKNRAPADTSTLKASKDRSNLVPDVHELLEEPVEEKVGRFPLSGLGDSSYKSGLRFAAIKKVLKCPIIAGGSYFFKKNQKSESSLNAELHKDGHFKIFDSTHPIGNGSQEKGPRGTEIAKI